VTETGPFSLSPVTMKIMNSSPFCPLSGTGDQT
jgi:hypothetical protein